MTSSFSIRIRPDLAVKISPEFPRRGRYRGGHYYSPFCRNNRALRLRIRPDVGALVLSGFPWCPDAWQAHKLLDASIMVG